MNAVKSFNRMRYIGDAKDKEIMLSQCLYLERLDRIYLLQKGRTGLLKELM
jgi:hypothetical protein